MFIFFNLLLHGPFYYYKIFFFIMQNILLLKLTFSDIIINYFHITYMKYLFYAFTFHICKSLYLWYVSNSNLL